MAQSPLHDRTGASMALLGKMNDLYEFLEMIRTNPWPAAAGVVAELFPRAHNYVIQYSLTNLATPQPDGQFQCTHFSFFFFKAMSCLFFFPSVARFSAARCKESLGETHWKCSFPASVPVTSPFMCLKYSWCICVSHRYSWCSVDPSWRNTALKHLIKCLVCVYIIQATPVQHDC